MMISFKLGNDHHSKSKVKELMLKGLKFCSHFINLEKARKKLFKLTTKHNNEKTKRVISYGSGYLLKAVFDYDYCTNKVLHKFMDKKYYIPRNYDKFLRQLYNDYTLDPPQEMQNPIHPIEDIKF